jgi:hypothetical protein
MNVRMPSSLNKFRFAEEGTAGDASTSSGIALPATAPATGKTDNPLIASLRFISLYLYILIFKYSRADQDYIDFIMHEIRQSEYTIKNDTPQYGEKVENIKLIQNRISLNGIL